MKQGAIQLIPKGPNGKKGVVGENKTEKTTTWNWNELFYNSNSKNKTILVSKSGETVVE